MVNGEYLNSELKDFAVVSTVFPQNWEVVLIESHISKHITYIVHDCPIKREHGLKSETSNM